MYNIGKEERLCEPRKRSKSSGRRAFVPGPRRGSLQHFPGPLAGGEGTSPPKNPTPLGYSSFALRPFRLQASALRVSPILWTPHNVNVVDGSAHMLTDVRFRDRKQWCIDALYILKSSTKSALFRLSSKVQRLSSFNLSR